MERRATQPDKRAVQYLWMVESASERILVTWTPANGSVIMIVVAHRATTRCPSFANAVETDCHGMLAALWDVRAIHAAQPGAD